MINRASFQPAWWLNNCHLQTVYPALFRRPPAQLRRCRQRLELADGDFLDLDWQGSEAAPLILLLHGLAGNSDSPYILGLQQALAWQGWASVVLNFRGCSGQPNRLARAYHAGETDDLMCVWHYLRQRYPARKLAVVGFSLGGNVLLKWLGEGRTIVGLAAAVAVSVPLRLDLCATRLDSGGSRCYREYLLRDLKRYMRRKQQALQQHGQLEEAGRIQRLGNLDGIHSFWTYDDRVVAPLHGFKGVDEYYHRSSGRQYLRHITHPCLLLQAEDDPFMTPEVLPAADELSASVRLELAAGGGHVGFLSGTRPWQPEYWLEQRICTFLQAYIPAG